MLSFNIVNVTNKLSLTNKQIIFTWLFSWLNDSLLGSTQLILLIYSQTVLLFKWYFLAFTYWIISSTGKLFIRQNILKHFSMPSTSPSCLKIHYDSLNVKNNNASIRWALNL